MTEDEISQHILAYLVQFDDGEGENNFVNFSNIHSDLLFKTSWIEAYETSEESKNILKDHLSQMVDDGLLEESDEEFHGQRHFRLTDQGEYEGSLKLEDAVIHDDTYTRPPDQRFIDSANWAAVARGATGVRISEIKVLSSQLRLAILQSDADQTTQLNALKRLDAAMALIEAPDKPWKQIVEMLSSPYFSAFLTAANIIETIISWSINA